MPPPMRTLLLVIAAIWPLVLPGGAIWLVLYWSILLWSFCSARERSVLVTIWLIGGAAPIALASQQQVVKAQLSEPARLIDNFEQKRLYGSLFSDLTVLRTLLPESSAISELVADLHRRLGQWEYARRAYAEIAEDVNQTPAGASSALINLGVFYHRNGDYGTAVTTFRAASAVDSSSALAFYNLSQAYSQAYTFTESHEALGRAKEIDPASVDRWLEQQSDAAPAEAVLTNDGSLMRLDEIRAQLNQMLASAEAEAGLLSTGQRYFSLAVGVLALVLAILLGRVFYPTPLLSRKAADPAPASGAERWILTLVPGLASARKQRGWRTFLSILLPVIILLGPLMRRLGYGIPLAFDPSPVIGIALAVVLLLLLFGARLLLQLRAS